MSNPDHDAYDVVIIGAGISGLVAGCYLAKAGMKVLIAEQHFQPGGYCTSFKRKEFTFDAAAHSFGGYRAGGIMNKIITDFALSDRMRITRYDPSDVIISPDHQLFFWSSLDKTVQGLQTAFPHEAEKIHNFIHFLLHHEPGEFAALRKKTLKNLLDQYFADDKLKAALALPVLGNGDLPPSLISAFTAAKIYSEFLLDGGYYPEGGMQSLPDILSERFKEFGGTLLLSCRVEKITSSDHHVTGVVLRNGIAIRSKRVISNCDAHQTFLELLEKNIIGKEFSAKLTAMTPSLSMFVLYLGIDARFETLPAAGTNLWFLPHYDIEGLHLSAKEMASDQLAEYYMVRVSPDSKTVLAFVNAPFRDKKFWASKKKVLLESFLKRIEHNTIPHLSDHVVHKEAATPSTLYRYTLNHRGAAYGWAGTLSQFADPDFKKPSFVNGLYLTGHWTTYAQGLPGVAYLGYDTAKLILKRGKINI